MASKNTIDAYYDRVMAHYESGTSRGYGIGFKALDQFVSFKLGYTTYILGYPAAGKTEFHLEILFNLTQKFNWKHALYSGEIGTIEDVISELISKHLRKPFFKKYKACSEREVMEAMNWIGQFFYPVDPDEDYSVESFYEECLKIEKDNHIKLNTTSIDPWNDMEEDLSQFGGREDKYLAWALKKVRQTANKNNWHNFIVTHARDEQPLIMKSAKGGTISCTPIPRLQSFAGGQVWSRRAHNVIGLWRPEEGAINPAEGIPFFEDEVMVLVLKSKPKGTGKKGGAPLFYNFKQNRYYEFVGAEQCFGWGYESITEEVELQINSIPVNPIINQTSELF